MELIDNGAYIYSIFVINRLFGFFSDFSLVISLWGQYPGSPSMKITATISLNLHNLSHGYWREPLSCGSVNPPLLVPISVTSIVLSKAQNSVSTTLSPSASPVIRLEMIRVHLLYTTAARGLLVGYDCLYWLGSLVTVMKYS